MFNFSWPPSESSAVALIALAGVIFGTIVTYLISRRSIYINSVTVERSKWIGELRANIANLSGHVLSINEILVATPTHQDSVEFFESAREIHRLTSLIKLQLNPFNEIDKNILQILDEFELSFQDPTHFMWVIHNRQLIAHAQFLLKAEWEKVKSEAAGLAWRPWFWLRKKLHTREYQMFVKSREGKLD